MHKQVVATYCVHCDLLKIWDFDTSDKQALYIKLVSSQ